MSKYRSVKTIIDHFTFDSKKEAAYYQHLKLRLLAHEICDLALQPEYPIEINGLKICKVKLDFRYVEKATGKIVVVDVKGMDTPFTRSTPPAAKGHSTMWSSRKSKRTPYARFKRFMKGFLKMDSKHPLFKQLGKSDDIARHERVFVYAYQSMINDRIATPADFENQGGWVRSIEHPDFYFVYVGDPTHVKNRYYLNTKNGHITKGNPNV